MENNMKENEARVLNSDEMETVSGGSWQNDIEKEIEKIRNEIAEDWRKYIPGKEDIEFWKDYFSDKRDPSYWKKFIPETDWSKYLDLIPKWK